MTRRTGMRPLRIAMIGQKGIPARYGGVETHVENVAARLAGRGHDVTVFARARFRGASELGPDGKYRGVRVRYRGSINTKHFDAATHAFACALEAGWRRFDIVHLHGIGPAAFAPIPRLFGRRVVSTFHALDWRQVKWGRGARRLLLAGEAGGARWSHGLIAVSRILQHYIASTYGVEATYIPNGATIPDTPPAAALLPAGLAPGSYFLTVGRIIPDRELHTLIEAFTAMDGNTRLVIVGAEQPRTAYSDRLLALANDRVLFTGEVFGPALDALYAHCIAYVLASRVEGLPTTVCEAMAHGRALVLSDIPENAEVGGDAAVYFKCGHSSELQGALRVMIDDTEARARLEGVARERSRESFNWDRIADDVESFFYQVMRGDNA